MPLLARKLANQVKRIDPELVPVNLRNIVVNGVKRGCSGFFTNPATGRFVYVNTEQPWCMEKGACMLRFAKDEKDFCGERNEWTDVDHIAAMVAKRLNEARSERSAA